MSRRYLLLFMSFIMAFSFFLYYASEVQAVGLLRFVIGEDVVHITKTNHSDFVDLQEFIPDAVIDMKYATTDNFTKAKLYDSSESLLRRGTAEKLKKVAEEVARDGYRLKIWDAYRNPKAQFKMWNIVKDARFIADPHKGYSNHSRGSAVDLTLVDAQGYEIPMPTGFDEFGQAALRSNLNENGKYLEKVMIKHGFKPLATEWWHFDDIEKYPVAESPQSISIPAMSPHETSIVVSAVGDVTLGQDERFPYVGSFNNYYDQYGPQYFFSNVRDILSKDDLTLANFEGTLTDTTKKPNKNHQGNQAFFFKGKYRYSEILQDGSVEAVNVANNHTMDFLAEGYADTQLALKLSGITTFGEESVAVFCKKGIAVGLIGVNALGPLEQGRSIDNVKANLEERIKELENVSSMIIVNFHWGTENEVNPNREQIELAHFAIDQGADLVLGHHPHVVQKQEIYKEKTILYSLGNFIFGGNSNPKYKDTMIFQQTFYFDNDQLVRSKAPVTIPCNLNARYQPHPN